MNVTSASTSTSMSMPVPENPTVSSRVRMLINILDTCCKLTAGVQHQLGAHDVEQAQAAGNAPQPVPTLDVNLRQAERLADDLSHRLNLICDRLGSNE